MKKRVSSKRGFMQIVLLAIIIIAALAYFNIDLRSVFENPIVQKIWNIFVGGQIITTFVSTSGLASTALRSR
jgi:hypothetical protein